MTGSSKAAAGKKGGKAAVSEKGGLILIKDVWMPIVGAILGFSLGVAQDIVKREYEYRMSTPRVRFIETSDPPVVTAGKFREEVTITFRSSGRATVPSLTMTADSSDPDTTVTVISCDGKPSYSPPDFSGIPRDATGQGLSYNLRGLRVTNLHEPQFIVCKIRAESVKPLADQPVHVKFYGTNDIQDEHNLSLTERISALPLALGLLVYAVVITIVAFLLYMVHRRDSRIIKEAT